MTILQRQQKIEENKKKYGLRQEEIKKLKKPIGFSKNNKKRIVVLNLNQIFQPKSNFSTVEKIYHLENLKKAILNKLNQIKKEKT